MPFADAAQALNLPCTTIFSRIFLVRYVLRTVRLSTYLYDRWRLQKGRNCKVLRVLIWSGLNFFFFFFTLFPKMEDDMGHNVQVTGGTCKAVH